MLRSCPGEAQTGYCVTTGATEGGATRGTLTPCWLLACKDQKKGDMLGSYGYAEAMSEAKPSEFTAAERGQITQQQQALQLER